MSNFFIAPIVSGHGEVQAVRILLERMIAESIEPGALVINPPIRVKEQSFLRDEEYMAKYITLAALKARHQEHPLILVLLDCDDDCPATQGPELLAKANAYGMAVPILVVLAKREYETWFLAAAISLRGVSGLPTDLVPPQNPEGIRDAKGWLSQRMNGYHEQSDQPRLTSVFSFEEASQVASFHRMLEKLKTYFHLT